MRRKVHYRWHNSWIDLCNDGMSDHEKIDGKCKKYLQRMTKARLMRELKKMLDVVQCN